LEDEQNGDGYSGKPQLDLGFDIFFVFGVEKIVRKERKQQNDNGCYEGPYELWSRYELLYALQKIHLRIKLCD